MSYDLRLYFSQQEFPHQEWNDILDFFHAMPHESANASFPPWAEAEWVIAVDSKEGDRVWKSPVWIDLRVYRVHDCAPQDTRWTITLSTSGSASAKAVWTQFALVCSALQWMQGVTAHDCQWHNADNLYNFTEPNEWRDFASVALPRRVRKRELIKQGLMNENGKALF